MKTLFAGIRFWPVWLMLIFLPARAVETIVTFEYPPFFREGQKPEPQGGYVVDVYRALTDGTALEGQIVFRPLARAKLELDNGNFLIGLGTRDHHHPAIAAGKLIPVRVGSTKFHFFYLKSRFPTAPRHTRIDQYRAHTICGQNQSAVTDELAKHDMRYDIAKDLPGLFRKILAGRCDFGVTSDLAFQGFVRDDPSGPQFAMDDLLIHEVIADIIINAAHPNAQQIALDLTAGVARLRNNGTLLRLAKKNFGNNAVPDYFLKF